MEDTRSVTSYLNTYFIITYFVFEDRTPGILYRIIKRTNNKKFKFLPKLKFNHSFIIMYSIVMSYVQSLSYLLFTSTYDVV